MKTSLLSILPLLLLACTVCAGGDTSQVINGGGLRLFEAVQSGSKGNICLSPYSIQSALAMTYAGAGGSTREQMAAALGFPKDPISLAKGFQKLNAELLESAAGGGEDTALHVANRLFGASGFAFRPAFLDLLKRDFLAPLEELDFKKNPAAAAKAINAWVEEQTAKRIQNLIPADALTRDTTLVLVNALYLKMPWADEFPEGATKGLPFHVGGTAEVDVPTMSRTGSLGYQDLGEFLAVGIPFRGGQFQFLILLPKKENAGTLPPASVLEKCAGLPRTEVHLLLPKFKLQPPTIALGGVLQSLGVKAAFDIPQGSADFDGIAPKKPDDYLFISDVFHKTFFALDEKGVEAAAATAVVMMRATAMPMKREPVEVHVDRPFFFAVQHISTGTCLFFGKIIDPR